MVAIMVERHCYLLRRRLMRLSQSEAPLCKTLDRESEKRKQCASLLMCQPELLCADCRNMSALQAQHAALVAILFVLPDPHMKDLERVIIWDCDTSVPLSPPPPL